jgi:hypothetical protein
MAQDVCTWKLALIGAMPVGYVTQYQFMCLAGACLGVVTGRDVGPQLADEVSHCWGRYGSYR